MGEHMFFISHAEKDAEIVSRFVDLLYQIGVKSKNMFCSSIAEIGVPIKEDIYDYLRTLLDSEPIIPIFMLSENYYESAACLNEMGAVWMTQKDYFTFLLPGFEFKQIKGAINPNKRAIRLDNDVRKLKGDLSNFKNEICRALEVNLPDENYWERIRDNFIGAVQSFSPCIEIDITDCKGYCIGEVKNRGGCDVIVDEIRGKAIATFDFSKTEAELCSLVFFTGGINVCRQFHLNKKLHFLLKTSEDINRLTIEMHLNTRNIPKEIAVDYDWEDYAIPLKDFGGAESEWNNLKEISFIAHNDSVSDGTIQIKNIRIY